MFDENIDYVKIVLFKPLPPKQKITITTPFRVQIPYGNISRLGHLDQAYQITQWFPKPAVYDKNGWNVMPYLTQGEFYSEYGSYDAKITLPENYIVGATGDLVNGEEELKRLEENNIETRKLIESGKYKAMDDMSIPESSQKTKTLHYHQEKVHDFAWFADKRWHVLKGEVELPFSKRKVTTWAMFTNNEFDLWKDALSYIDSAVYYYSLWVGEYPYNQVTAVDGALTAGAGMEYPNVTVIGESHSAKMLEQVIVHEVGHNWFYGIIGSNERTHPWMDEGMNSFIENRTTEQLHPDGDLAILPKKWEERLGFSQYKTRGLNDLSYLYTARRNYDQPIELSSELYTPTNYGAIVYSKTAIGFDYLLAYLGDSLMDKCLYAYFDKWKFKHPQPEDVEAVFEQTSQKDLDWFFKDFIQTTKKIDYKVEKYNSKTKELTIKNKTNLPAPISYTVLDKDGNILHQEWLDGFKGEKTITIPEENAYKIELDYDMDIPELDRTDDVIKTQGICKTCRPTKFKLLGEIENREYNLINFLPVFGWNQNDGLMPGIAFYNTTFPEKKLEWLAIPMFSLKQKNLTGIGEIKYNLYPNQAFRKITFGANTRTFSFNTKQNDVLNNTKWYRNAFFVNIELKDKILRTAPKQTIGASYVAINEITGNVNTYTDFINLNYEIKNKQILKPKSLKVAYVLGNATQNIPMSTISLTGKARFNYNIKRDKIELRFFAGKTLLTDSTTTRYNWRTSGQTGLYDYQYNNIFLGRTATYPNFLAQQLGESHGGFKTYTRTGSSDKWIVSANVKADIPHLPFGVFADMSYYPYKEVTQNGVKDKIGNLYDAGIWIPIGKKFIDIYIPLLLSSDIIKEYDTRGVNFWQRITFTIQFNSLNPFKMIENIAP